MECSELFVGSVVPVCWLWAGAALVVIGEANPGAISLPTNSSVERLLEESRAAREPEDFPLSDELDAVVKDRRGLLFATR
jgi:hypothetical protein